MSKVWQTIIVAAAVFPFLFYRRPVQRITTWPSEPPDYYWGWPLSYGRDQNDVVGEFLWMLSGFSWLRFAADLAIGLALGVLVVLCIQKIRKIRARKSAGLSD